MNGAQAISVSVKAVVIEDDRILLVEYQYPGDTHYNLPGGRARYGEPLREALVRKVREETGAEVEVDRLLFVVEYVPERWDYEFGDYQKVQFNFLCRMAPGSPRPAMPEELDDKYQTAVSWVPLDEMEQLVLLPKVTPAIKAALAEDGRADPLVDRW
ncbi:NUDIX domain-containing protein [Plantactinospora sp. B6F1]|uniref:NUDIX domain-containing protein n=1 Tax=Plantactinospora sp. B6F1 TaxID=3158971 RepID=UPI00102AB51F